MAMVADQGDSYMSVSESDGEGDGPDGCGDGGDGMLGGDGAQDGSPHNGGRTVGTTREERLQRSRERNREHARRTRLRKKAQMQMMQARVAELHAESATLRNRLDVSRRPLC